MISSSQNQQRRKKFAGVLPALYWFRSYARTRLPFGSLILPLALSFPLSCILYHRLSGQPINLSLVFIAEWLSFILLFVQLRLIDDLDDVQDDHNNQHQQNELTQHLSMLLIITASTLIVLNMASFRTLSAVIFATLISYAGPFLIKRFLPPHPASLVLGWLVFEGAPASFFAYIYFAWLSHSPAEALSITQIAPVAGMFWLAYEIWKFSRKVHVNAMQPYFLPKKGVRGVLSLLLVLAAALMAALADMADFSAFGRYGAGLLPLVFLVWMNGTWPDLSGLEGRETVAAPAWNGMSFLVIFEIMLSVEFIFEWVRL
ncbi:hypothetical protein [Methylobacter sp.]|uniref:hypothetical protein n=1 Tax=Methylobacter sp. TaxID=2051955 RepID=UPI003DA472BD